MKKAFFVFLFCAVVLSAILIAAAGCSKSSPAAPASTGTPSMTNTPNWTATLTPSRTPTGTVTMTATVTMTQTNTATPVIVISCMFYSDTNVASCYKQVRVLANLTPVADATAVINSTPVPYTGADGYYMLDSDCVVPGTTYIISVTTNNSTYTDFAVAPGGSAALNGAMPNYTLTWANEGNEDSALVRNSTGTITYQSSATLTDITSGFALPGSTAFPSSGDYTVFMYNMEHKSSFTTAQGGIYIEVAKSFSVTKP